EAKHTIPFEIRRSSRPPQPTSSQSFTPTVTVPHIISADFTTWLSISVGFPGPSSRNEHGPKSAAKVNVRSVPKNMQQSSLQKKMQSAALITNCFTRPVLPKPMQQILRQTLLIGEMAFLFIAGRNSDHSANRVA